MNIFHTKEYTIGIVFKSTNAYENNVYFSNAIVLGLCQSFRRHRYDIHSGENLCIVTNIVVVCDIHSSDFYFVWRNEWRCNEWCAPKNFLRLNHGKEPIDIDTKCWAENVEFWLEKSIQFTLSFFDLEIRLKALERYTKQMLQKV